MIPYFLLILIPSVFALLNTRQLSLPLWWFTFLCYVLFVGLRGDNVGPDAQQYGYIHSSLAYLNFWDVATQTEPLSYILFWISENNGYHVYLSNFVAALITMTGVFTFARRTVNPWLAVVAATPYFIIVMGMSGIRQAMAAGVVLFLFSRWERYSFIRRAAYILIAAMFHTSALVNNIFLVVKMNISLRYKLVLGTLVFLLTLYLSLQVSMYADNVERYQERYLQGSFVVQSFGSLYHIAMIMIPTVIGVIFRKRISDKVYNLTLLHFGLYAAGGVFLMNFISSTVASRLTVYLYFLPMMVYPALAMAGDKGPRLGNVFAVIGVHLAIMLGWFELGNVAFSYVPYENILFD